MGKLEPYWEVLEAHEATLELAVPSEIDLKSLKRRCFKTEAEAGKVSFCFSEAPSSEIVYLLWWHGFSYKGKKEITKYFKGKENQTELCWVYSKVIY